MLQTILPEEMKRVEQRVIIEGGIAGLTLMEHAATHVANVAAPYLKEGGRVLAVCGAGNNGADGLAAVRILLTRMPSLKAVIWKLPGAPTAETAKQWARLVPLMARISVHALAEEADVPAVPVDVACVVDAMYGTGLSRPLAGAARKAAQCLAKASVPVVAVDSPSGLCGITGQVLGGAEGTCVRAEVTVTFHRPKPGLFLAEGLDACGRVVVADIGIPAALDDAHGMAVLVRGDTLLPPRKRNTHKGDYGRVLLLVGSHGMAGAAAISALAALRAGAGLCTVACVERIVPTVQTLCPCATCLPLPQEDAPAAWGLLLAATAKADALVIGCGLGQDTFSYQLLTRLLPWLAAHPLPAVLDADALNLLAAHKDGDFAGLRFLPQTVLTPHIGEAARLLGVAAAEVEQNQPAAAQAVQARYGASVVLKSASTVIVAQGGQAISLYGSPAMAKGGSGDALAGVLGALMAGQTAYGISGVRLMQVACALHGLAGLLATEVRGERGMLATDLCEALGRVSEVAQRGEVTIAPLQLPEKAIYDSSTVSMHDDSDELAALGYREEGTVPHASTAHAAHGAAAALGRKVRVTVDRPLGSRHPERRDTVYQLNYGYVADVLAADNEWQDAYVWGVKEPIAVFEGEVIAVIHRLNDAEDKWVVAAVGTRVTAEEIRTGTAFTEQYYQSRILVIKDT